ncbi:MAG TPA: hypothetical protein VH370_17910 [Humisphaera sp.]|jgi:hypothetical protein|nr:hypothetical protein [Humisphaera sp.]
MAKKNTNGGEKPGCKKKSKPQSESSEPRRGKAPALVERRGLAKSLTEPFHALAIAAPNGRDDADQLLDAMLAQGWIGAARRDVSGELLAGRVLRPMGPWGLIVQLVGHPWLYFVGDDLQYAWVPQIARKLGVRTALFEYSGMTGTLLARAYEGDATLFELNAADSLTRIPARQ